MNTAVPFPETIATLNWNTANPPFEVPASQSAYKIQSASDPELATAFRRLQSFESLPENWNSYQARRIGPNTIRLAREVLSVAADLCSMPGAIVPVANGSIQLEWEVNDREIEVEVRPDKTLRILLVEDSVEAEADGIPVEDLSTEALFKLLYGDG